jgi:hypothetical protein
MKKAKSFLKKLYLLFPLAAASCMTPVVSVGPAVLRSNGTTPDGEIGIYVSGGSTFNPYIEVDSGASVEWFFSGYGGGAVTGTAESSALDPTTTYTGTMLATLKVTPWSALRTIDVGYDGNDGGALPLVPYQRPDQNVTSVANLSLARDGLRIWCSSLNLDLKSLDFGGFHKLETIESYFPWNAPRDDVGLASIGLAGTSSLRRLCLENNNLTALDLSDCVALEDLRGAMNAYPSVTWPASMANLWHVCVRDNPQFTVNVPVDRMPALSECLIWHDSQGDVFAPNSSVLTQASIAVNNFTSIDLRGAKYATTDGSLDASDSSVESVLVGSSGVRILNFTNCSLGTAAIADLLSDLDSSGVLSGTLILTGNPGSINTGSSSYQHLRDDKGWTITN